MILTPRNLNLSISLSYPLSICCLPVIRQVAFWQIAHNNVTAAERRSLGAKKSGCLGD